MENLDQVKSSLDKDIHRLRKTCTKLFESNKLRKLQITQFNLFIKKLLLENRITVEELSQYILKREKK